MSSTNICIKTVYKGEVRRISLAEAKLKVRILERIVKKQFGLEFPLLQYHDDEDDKITIRVNDELEEAVRVAARLNKVLRLLVSADPSAKASAKAASAKAAKDLAPDESKAESKADADGDWRAKKGSKGSKGSKFKAAFVVDKTLPDGSTVEAGAALTKVWTFKNAGAAAWPAGMALVCKGGNMKPKQQRVALPAAAPGAEFDVSVELVAPKGGRGKSVWHFVDGRGEATAWGLTVWAYVVVGKPKAGAAQAAAAAKKAAAKKAQVEWHSAWAAKKKAWAAKKAFRAAFVADKLLADGAEVAVAERFTKTWSVRNCGALAWPEGTVLVCDKSVNMEAAEQRVALPAAAPNAEVDVSVELSVAEAGPAKSVWTVADGDGNRLSSLKLWTNVVGVAKAAEAPQPQEEDQSEVAFVADKTLPDGTEVAAGELLTKTWTVRNSGQSVWPATNMVCVGGNLAPEGTRVAVPSVAAGAEVDVSVELTAGAGAPGDKLKSVWRFEETKGRKAFRGDALWAALVLTQPAAAAAAAPAVEEPVAAEPAAAEPAAAEPAAAEPAFKVAFVADKTLPDGTEVAAGELLTKTWTVRNSGDVAWPHGGVMLACAQGNMMATPAWKVLPTLAPGAQMDVSVQLTAQAAAQADGRGRSEWVFQDASGKRLSDAKLWVDVKVQREEAAETKAEPAAAEAPSAEQSAAGEAGPSWARLAMGALAGGVVGVAHMMKGGDGAAEEVAHEADGFKTAEEGAEDEAGEGEDFEVVSDDGAVLVVPADAEAAVEMVEVAVADTAVQQAEAAAAAPKPDGPWKEQLTQLAEMGFSNGAVMVPLLEEHKGNVHRVVLSLLQQFQQ